MVNAVILYTERGSRRVNVCPWDHIARLLQEKAEPGASNFGFGRHDCAVGVARIYLTGRSPRPNRLGHSGNHWRRNPLRCDLGVPPLSIPTEALEADTNTP